MTLNDVQYITDADGREVGVILPIELWREISSELETAHLLSSEATKKHLLCPGERAPSLTLEAAGIEICEETGLPVFRMPVGAPQISTEFIRSLEDEW